MGARIPTRRLIPLLATVPTPCQAPRTVLCVAFDFLFVWLFMFVFCMFPVFIHSRHTCPTFKCSLLQGVSRLSYCDISCMYTCTWITTITVNTIALGLQRDDPADMRIVSEITGDKATNCAFCLVPDPPAM